MIKYILASMLVLRFVDLPGFLLDFHSAWPLLVYRQPEIKKTGWLGRFRYSLPGMVMQRPIQIPDQSSQKEQYHGIKEPLAAKDQEALLCLLKSNIIQISKMLGSFNLIFKEKTNQIQFCYKKGAVSKIRGF